MKLAVVLLVIFIGAAHLDKNNLSPFIPPNEGTRGKFGFSGTLQAATTVFFAYIGFDGITTLAQETREPQRNLPIGILGSLSICTMLYMGMCTVMVGVVPYAEYKDVVSPVAFMAKHMGMPWLSIYTSAAALCGLTTVLLVSLMGQPRIFYSMAKDGLLPPGFALVHRRFKTPHVTTAISGVVVAIAAGALPIDFLADMTSIGTLFAFVFVSVAVVVLRYTQPDAPRLFRVPSVQLPRCGWELHIIPVLSVICCCALICFTTVETLWRFFGWLIVGMLIYFCYGFWHSKLREKPEDASTED